METRDDATTIVEAVRSICEHSSDPQKARFLLAVHEPFYQELQAQAETVSASFLGDITIPDEVERFTLDMVKFVEGLTNLRQRIHEALTMGQLLVEDHVIREFLQEVVRDHVWWALQNFHRRFQNPANSA